MDELPYGVISSIPQDSITRKLLVKAGIAYGVIFGLGFALLTWGLDSLALLSNGAALPFIKLFMGLPIALLACALAGWWGGASSSAIVPVTLWAVVCGGLGVLAGHIPFEGHNLVIWLLEPRLWGEVIFSFDNPAKVRTILIVMMSAPLGAAVGYIESLAVQWAWDRKTARGGLSLGSWMALLVAIPMAILPAAVANSLMNQPLSIPQRAVGELLNLTLSGEIDESGAYGSSYRSLKPYLGSLSEQYETYFVSFGSETGSWYSAYIDVAFDNGFVMRCATSGDDVIYCDDFRARLMGWADDLVRAGLYGERPWEEAKVRRLVVENTVVAWLAAHRDQLSENYQAERASQQSGWVFVSVQFDTGFNMLCRFRNAAPVVVDQCIEVEPGAP
ncbi:MAG: hypothetical protein JXA78_07710 [Anaerolineales bacterium]|nr:hypothetical protein [Anaerolineales bacterium]